jgi:hypothetical protein
MIIVVRLTTTMTAASVSLAVPLYPVAWSVMSPLVVMFVSLPTIFKLTALVNSAAWTLTVKAVTKVATLVFVVSVSKDITTKTELVFPALPLSPVAWSAILLPLVTAVKTPTLFKLTALVNSFVVMITVLIVPALLFVILVRKGISIRLALVFLAVVKQTTIWPTVPLAPAARLVIPARKLSLMTMATVPSVMRILPAVRFVRMIRLVRLVILALLYKPTVLVNLIARETAIVLLALPFMIV